MPKSFRILFTGASSANPSKTTSIDSIDVYFDFLDATFCKNMWEAANIDLGGCIAKCKSNQIEHR